MSTSKAGSLSSRPDQASPTGPTAHRQDCGCQPQSLLAPTLSAEPAALLNYRIREAMWPLNLMTAPGVEGGGGLISTFQLSKLRQETHVPLPLITFPL